MLVGIGFDCWGVLGQLAVLEEDEGHVLEKTEAFGANTDSKGSKAILLNYPPSSLNTLKQEIQVGVFRDLQVAVPSMLSRVLVI